MMEPEWKTAKRDPNADKIHLTPGGPPPLPPPLTSQLGDNDVPDLIAWLDKALSETTERTRIDIYRKLEKATSHAYFLLSPPSRTSVMSIPSLICQLGSAVGFLIWFWKTPSLRLSDLLSITSAYAQAGNPPAPDFKPYIFLGIFIVLLMTFLVSLWILYFYKPTYSNTKATETADSIVKGTFGFFLGAGATYLGVAIK
jgi:hypothetical protein